MKTTITVAFAALLAVFATSAVAETQKTQEKARIASSEPKPELKPELKPDDRQGNAKAKVECLTGADFREASTSDEYYEMKKGGKRPFYVSGTGVTTVPSWLVSDAVKACGDILGAQH